MIHYIELNGCADSIIRDSAPAETGLAQLVEHWSPKPGVGSSSLSTRANKMSAVISYIKDSFKELRNHVRWTPKSELLERTVVVVVFSIIFSLIIWAADSVLSRFVKFYFELIS